MSCPALPPIPEDVKSRFRSMRGWDARLRKYGDAVCSAIPEEYDASAIEARVDALESQVANHEALIASLTSSIALIISGVASRLTWKVVSATPYTVVDHNVGLRVVTTTLAITVNLPPAAAWEGESIFIKDDSGNAALNNITVVPNGTNTVDDDTSLVIDANYAGVELKSNGTGWEIV